MQDGYRILGSGKSGKMAKIYQHHKFPPCLGYPKHGGKDKENLTHFFRHYRMFVSDNCLLKYIKPTRSNQRIIPRQDGQKVRNHYRLFHTLDTRPNY